MAQAHADRGRRSTLVAGSSPASTSASPVTGTARWRHGRCRWVRWSAGACRTRPAGAGAPRSTSQAPVMTCATCCPTAPAVRTARASAASPTRSTPSGSRARRSRIRCCRSRSRPPASRPPTSAPSCSALHGQRQSLLKSRQHLLNELVLLADRPWRCATGCPTPRLCAAGRVHAPQPPGALAVHRPRCDCGSSTATAQIARLDAPSKTSPSSSRSWSAAGTPPWAALRPGDQVGRRAADRGRRPAPLHRRRLRPLQRLSTTGRLDRRRPQQVHLFNPGGNRHVNAILHQMAVARLLRARADDLHQRPRPRAHQA